MKSLVNHLIPLLSLSFSFSSSPGTIIVIWLPFNNIESKCFEDFLLFESKVLYTLIRNYVINTFRSHYSKPYLNIYI